jgi:hypothetical protein
VSGPIDQNHLLRVKLAALWLDADRSLVEMVPLVRLNPRGPSLGLRPFGTDKGKTKTHSIIRAGLRLGMVSLLRTMPKHKSAQSNRRRSPGFCEGNPYVVSAVLRRP